MKTLGYHRIVSLENFRTPNFELVADALYWLVERYDPTAEISDDIRDENARVEFLKAIARTMASKARIKLNIKALYRADGYAVRELLKIAEVLVQSLKASSPEDGGDDQKSNQRDGISGSGALESKLEELKQAKNMANDIVESGSKLYTLLGQEGELKKNREKAIQFVDSISMNLESNAAREVIERNIREQINNIADNVSQLEKMCADLAKDKKSLNTKMERKQTDLERAEKRYQNLKKYVPAHIDDYERLETELKIVYEHYLERFRNLNYLEAELEKYHETEREKQRESDRVLRRMQRRMKEEELRVLRGDGEGGGREGEDLDQDEDEDEFAENKNKRPKGAGGRRGGKAQSSAVGSMDAGSSEDDSSDSGLGDGDSKSGSDSQDHSGSEDGSGSGSQFDDEDEDEAGLTDEDDDNLSDTGGDGSMQDGGVGSDDLGSEDDF